MSPINWITLFLLFNVTVFLIVVKLYFLPSLKFLTSFQPPHSSNPNKLNSSPSNWKW
uniref:ATP synthase F0 subunit 8 n=1 Tax=Podura aquatica TaxID=50589 RepID=Q6DVG4_9HEXA|nr:ATP synthase F0 subunit 8 [Podura aquatica]AAT69335.1 ATP synthase F0 subunit 8 [Podura aquatica]